MLETEKGIIREKANKGMPFEEYIQRGICLGTCFRLQVLKEFQMDMSRKQRCVVFPFLHSFRESCVHPSLVTHTHTQRGEINTRAKTVATQTFNEPFSCSSFSLWCQVGLWCETAVKSQELWQSTPSNQLSKRGCTSLEHHNLHNVPFPLHPLGLLLILI